MKTITRKIVLPEWTKWVAQDGDGDWYAFEKEPTIYEEDCQWLHPDGEEFKIICKGTPRKSWRRSLQRVVDNTNSYLSESDVVTATLPYVNNLDGDDEPMLPIRKSLLKELLDYVIEEKNKQLNFGRETQRRTEYLKIIDEDIKTIENILNGPTLY